jgi:hypothetical protein
MFHRNQSNFQAKVWNFFVPKTSAVPTQKQEPGGNILFANFSILFHLIHFQRFEICFLQEANFFSKKAAHAGSKWAGDKRSPNVLHTNLTTLTMTATLSYTLLLGVIYFVRKMWTLKPQNA